MFDTIRRLSVQVRAAERADENARNGLRGLSVGALESKMRPIDDARRALRIAVHTLDPEQIAAAATLLKTRAERVTPPRARPSTVIATVTAWAPPAALLLVGLVFLFLAFFRRGGKP